VLSWRFVRFPQEARKAIHRLRKSGEMRRLNATDIRPHVISTWGVTFDMKKPLVLFAILLGFGISAAHASTYVCQLTLAPPVVDPTLGTSGYISMFTTPSPNCAGANTEQFICSKGATNHLCGVNAQYSEAALIALYETLRSAQSVQHQIVPYWNACVGAGGSCTGGVFLYPDF
jgi:hypothetical protein